MARTAPSATELHSRSVAEADRGRFGEARRLLRTALRHDPDPAGRAQILVSLAYHEAERHDLDSGITLLDEADRVPGLPDRVRALVASQRGLLHMRAGELTKALESFDAALALLDESVAEDLCRVLLNLGFLQLRRRSFAEARADFARCVDVATGAGLDVLAAKAAHNLGFLALFSGDLPQALHQMDAVGSVLQDLSPVMVAVYYGDRAQVLLAAGLVREADEDLSRAVAIFGGAGMRQNQAEAELARASVALAEERWADARQLAQQARRRFAARGASTWALLAEHVVIESTVESRRGLARAARDAGQLAATLSAVGLPDDARLAALTAGAAEVRRGDPASARAVAGSALRLRRDDPIATRLRARAVRAALADAAGQPQRTDRELKAAMTELQRYQSSLGSIDMQTAVSRHGHRLAQLGLARALATGRPAAIFGWAERARAVSARLRPVVPPADPEAGRLLEELRHARVLLRDQQLARHADPALRARCAALERAIRQRSWHLSGSRALAQVASIGTVQDELRPASGTLVAHLVADGELHCLLATGRRRAVFALGPAAPVTELIARLHADLDVLAGSHLPAPLRTVALAAQRSASVRLDELLWAPLRRHLDDGPLLLAPSARLSTLPWTLLPTPHGRPATVVASATRWLAARSRAALPPDPATAIAAGPHVARAVEEAQLVGRQWPRARCLTGAAATAAGVREQAATVDILHVAAHGVHERDNPLFSYLELADGPLFGHELDQLPALPRHVVLSACELGLAGTRPGDETLGMTAALLHGGAGSVVAGVARISDDVACRVGAEHHSGLRRGLSPAAALAEALATATDDEPAPLVCFGAGW